MFIAMNRLKVGKEHAKEFEQMWLGRDSHLGGVDGFNEFHLLRGPERDDYILYSSHTVWASKAAFEAWTKSEAFRKAHATAGAGKSLYLDHPQFEGFEVIQTLGRTQAAAE